MKKNISLLLAVMLVIVTPVYTYSYNEDLAKELVNPASVSYCPQAIQLNLSCGHLCDEMKSYGYQTLTAESIQDDAFTNEAFSIFYKQKDNQIIISFRGTHGKVQLFEELLYSSGARYTLQLGFVAVRVHAYFYSHYADKIRTKLIPALLKAKRDHPSASYIIIGHSLGGAYATIAALDFATSGIVNKSLLQVYTYGSPRVGNYEFAKAVDRTGISIFRVVNSRDPVPRAPSCLPAGGRCSKGPQSFGPGWAPYHVDNEIFYPDALMNMGEYRICSDESVTCANGDGFDPFQYDINAHLNYFGIELGCSEFETVAI